MFTSISDRLLALVGRLRGRKAAAEAPASFAARQGLWGEKEAEKHLLSLPGWKLLARRKKIGRDELDLVMEEGSGEDRTVVFVEVKTRSSETFGGGRAALDRRKRHALCRAAARYMRRLPPRPFRIDLVEVYGRCDAAAPARIEHQRAAVPLERRYAAEGLTRSARRRWD